MLLPAAACSVLPPDDWPPRVFGDMELSWPLQTDASTLVELPASDERLAVLDVSSDPTPLRELVLDGRWLLEFAPGTGDATVRLSYRLFADRNSPAPFASALQFEEERPGGRLQRHHARLGRPPHAAAANGSAHDAGSGGD